MLTSLDTGLMGDDYVHLLMLDGSHELGGGFLRAPLDIFRFCGPRFSPLLIRDGVFTWWDDPSTKLNFWRPVSSLTHYLDHALWRDTPWLMHLQCWVWGVILLLGVRALYRVLIADRFVATLALALYALDDARGWFVCWIAARNAVVATSFSVWALVFYHRGRAQRSQLAGVVSLALLALALLAGEGSIATYGYIFASALFLEHGALGKRLLRLWPQALLLVAWRVAYRALDYGVSGSALYADPLSTPLHFLRLLVEHAPILLQAQLGGMWSDTWNSSFMYPTLFGAIYLASVAGVALFGALLAPHVKRQPVVRYALFGALLAVLPASAAFLADRLLTWIALGACILVAELLAPQLRRQAGPPLSPALARSLPSVVFLLVLANLVFAPLFLPSRARGNVALQDVLSRADGSVPSDPSIRDKTLVFVNPPAFPLAGYIPIMRAAQGVPRARAQRILATATTEVTVSRVDEHTLRVRPRAHFFTNPASRLMWDQSRVFHVGEHIALGDVDVRISEVTAEHLPIEIEARFAKVLEDPSYVWRQWLGARYAPFAPPPVGQRVVLPAADYMQVLLGKKLPFEARY